MLPKKHRPAVPVVSHHLDGSHIRAPWACCIPLPTLGFAAFRLSRDPDRRSCLDDVSVLATLLPSKNFRVRQPYRITAAWCLHEVALPLSRPRPSPCLPSPSRLCSIASAGPVALVARCSHDPILPGLMSPPRSLPARCLSERPKPLPRTRCRHRAPDVSPQSSPSLLRRASM